MRTVLKATALSIFVLGVIALVAYAAFSSGVPTTCPQYLEGGNPEWSVIYCGRSYLWVPRIPDADPSVCYGGLLIRLANCVKLDDPTSAYQQELAGGWPPSQAWPWDTGAVGLIVYDSVSRPQQVLEVAACGDTYARWPRTCYTEFVSGASGTMLGVGAVLFLVILCFALITGARRSR